MQFASSLRALSAGASLALTDLVWSLHTQPWRPDPWWAIANPLAFVTLCAGALYLTIERWLPSRLVRVSALYAAAPAVLLALLAIQVVRRPPYAVYSPPPPVTGAEAPPIPRIFLITVDALRRDALASYGGAHPTPNFDRIHDQTIEACSAAPWTAPSFGSLFSGLPPVGHGLELVDHRPDPRLTYLAETLRQRGYRTGAAGYNYFLAPVPSNGVYARAFDQYAFGPELTRPQTHASALLEWAWPATVKRSWTTTDIVDRSLDWLAAQPPEAPLFYWMHIFDPHLPYDPPAEFYPVGKPAPGVGPVWDIEDLEAARAGTELSPAALAWIRQLYEAEVQYADRELGRFLDDLDARGWLDQALIILTADHGEEFGEHGGVDHGHSLYGELLRVPFLVHEPVHLRGKIGPLVVPGARADCALSTVAVPSIIDGYLSAAAGATSPFPLPSKDFVVSGAYTGELREGVVLVNEGWRYIEGRESGSQLLFDLTADPGEYDDLAASTPPQLQTAQTALDDGNAAARATAQQRGITGSPDAAPRADPETMRSLGYIQ